MAPGDLERDPQLDNRSCTNFPSQTSRCRDQDSKLDCSGRARERQSFFPVPGPCSCGNLSLALFRTRRGFVKGRKHASTESMGLLAMLTYAPTWCFQPTCQRGRFDRNLFGTHLQKAKHAASRCLHACVCMYVCKSVCLCVFVFVRVCAYVCVGGFPTCFSRIGRVRQTGKRKFQY